MEVCERSQSYAIKLFCSATLYQATFIHYYNRFVLYLLSLMIGNINPTPSAITENLSFAPSLSHLFLSPPVSFTVSLFVLHSFCSADDATPNRRYHSYTSHVRQIPDLSFFFPCSLSSRIFHRIKIGYLSKTRRLSGLNYSIQEQRARDYQLYPTESHL